MSRLHRRLLNLLTALSLLLCVVVCAVWTRSYFAMDQVRYRRGTFVYSMTIAGGQVDLSARDEAPFRVWPADWRWNAWSGRGAVNQRLYWRQSVASPGNPFTQQPVRRTRFGFWSGAQSDPAVSTLSWLSASPGSFVTGFVYAPVWPVAIACALLPAARATAWVVRHRRVRRGLCPRCRYDLTGNVSGVCPECGRPAS